MNLLAIDTSTELATVALSAQGQVYSKEQGSLREHAQFLLPMIDDLLSTAGLSFKQLDAIVFGRGPGSFTGLRIACSVAKGLAYAHDLPVYPVSGLESIAFQIDDSEKEDSSLLAMLDARMNQVYWGVWTDGVLEKDEQVSAALDVHVMGKRPIIVAGTGIEIYEPGMSEDLRARIKQRYTVFPKASAMIGLVLAGNVKAVSAADALPVYIRNQVTHGCIKGESGG